MTQNPTLEKVLLSQLEFICGELNMTITEIIKQGLENYDFTGVYSEDCGGCSIEDFPLCTDLVNLKQCRAGYKHNDNGIYKKPEK